MYAFVANFTPNKVKIMKVDIKKLPKSEVQLTITVPYDVYQKWEKKALEDLGKQVKVDGFRSGNIPEDVVRKNVSDDALKGTTLDYLFQQTYAEAVQKNDIQVIARPKVDIKTDIKKEGDDFVYEAIVAVMPEIKVGDYKKIKIAREEAKVEPKKVEETLDMIMSRFAEWKVVERKAKADDRAELDFEGFDEEGKAIPNTASKNHPVVIGSKAMVPGFEDAIIGMSAGEKKEFDVAFPKDYHAKPMQGKKVTFKIIVKQIEEKEEQKMDEEMVEKVTGEKQNVADFKKRVEEDLKTEVEQKIKQEFENKVVTEIIKITKMEVPEALIDQELEGMLGEQKQRVKQQGLEWDKYLEHIKKTEEDFTKEMRGPAEERIKARLGVQHIIKDAKIEVSDKEAEEKAEEMIKKYPEAQQKAAREHFKTDEKAMHYLKHEMSADKLFEMFTK